MKLFLSHRSINKESASLLAKALNDMGHEVWFAPKEIRAGKQFDVEIEIALQSTEAFILFATVESVGDESNVGSDEVKAEIKIARELGIPIIALDVDGRMTPGKGGVGLGFGYLLKNFQWMTNIEALLLLGNHASVATLINAELLQEDGKKYIELTQFSEHLSEAEQLLKNKQTDRVKQYLSKLQFPSTLPSKLHGELQLLKVIAYLQGKTLKNISKSDADNCVKALQNILNNEELTTPSYYLQAILSEYSYRRNGIADTTSGLYSLKKKAQNGPRLKAKYIKMLDQLIPEHDQFLQRWRAF